MPEGAFFHNMTHISGESDRIFKEILSQRYPWTRKSPSNFGGNPDAKSGSTVRTGDPDQILLPWRRYVVCGLRLPWFTEVISFIFISHYECILLPSAIDVQTVCVFYSCPVVLRF